MTSPFGENLKLPTAARPLDTFRAISEFDARRHDYRGIEREGIVAELFDGEQPLTAIQQFTDSLNNPREHYSTIGIWTPEDGISVSGLARLYTRHGLGIKEDDYEAAKSLLQGDSALAVAANRTTINHLGAIFRGYVEGWHTADARQARAPGWDRIDPDTFMRANLPQSRGAAIGDNATTVLVTQTGYSGEHVGYSLSPQGSHD